VLTEAEKLISQSNNLPSAGGDASSSLIKQFDLMDGLKFECDDDYLESLPKIGANTENSK